MRLGNRGIEQGGRPVDSIGRRPTRRSDGGPRRLLVAFVLCALLAVGCWVVAPLLGVYMPAIVPLLGFGAIALGTVVGAIQNAGPRGGGGDDEAEVGGDDDGPYRIESY